MMVAIEQAGGELLFRFTPEADDRADGPRVRLARPQVHLSTTEPAARHPDLLALSAILLVVPWASSITMPDGVSRPFAEAARAGLGLAVGPVDDALSHRARPRDGRPGLAYSGGTDCTAALLVMPPQTAAYFMERVAPPGASWVGSYNKSAALDACTRLADMGRLVRVVQSDMEFIRDPLGFPHDLANAIPAILAADTDRLDSIGWGAILESTYQVGSTTYRPYELSPFIRQFGPLFDAAGLPVFNPVAGVSEVGTAMIVRTSPLADIAQSCMRGTPGEPCRRCWKCARKILLESSLSGDWPRHGEIVRMLSRRNTPGYLRSEPIKHEGVVAYFTARYPRHDANDLLRLLAERVGGYEVDWLERWYDGSLAWSPENYRNQTAARLDEYLDRMRPADVEALTSWNLDQVTARPDRQAATARFLEALARRTPSALEPEPRSDAREEPSTPTWGDRLRSWRHRR